MGDNRRVRVFVSSTFRDMAAERDALMAHAWPELRRFCRLRDVDFVEVDLRWGITEAQSERNSTLRICLNEIDSCRPYFIGLLGDCYGSTPSEDAFTADLMDNQPWLKDEDIVAKSITEIEFLHGVLNRPDMAKRAFFYFRAPAHAEGRGADFVSDYAASFDKLEALRERIRGTCATHHIPLHEGYLDPLALSGLVVRDLKKVIDEEYPVGERLSLLERDERDHEAVAGAHRRTYVASPAHFDVIDRFVNGNGSVFVLTGESGAGKTALIANWIARWRQTNPQDIIFQHYVESSPDSAIHWHLIRRLASKIKDWTGDLQELPRSQDELLHDFPDWLTKARRKAEQEGVRFIVALDALDQLLDVHDVRHLGWLPGKCFGGAMQLLLSTLPGELLEAVERRGWPVLRLTLLRPDERRQMTTQYLNRFSKALDSSRLDRLVSEPATANPQYLRTVLDELRITGTHDLLDERLNQYLAAHDIPALQARVLKRYEREYEQDRAGLVGESLGLIWAARKGLTEGELLELLRPPELERLPVGIWASLRSALDESLVDRGGILNFAHASLRAAVEKAFVPSAAESRTLRLRLADFYEKQSILSRSFDELPWLLAEAKEPDRLRACLLDLDRCLLMWKSNPEEVLRYWVALGQEREMGALYVAAFDEWRKLVFDELKLEATLIMLISLLHSADLQRDCEPLVRRLLALQERVYGADHLCVNSTLTVLASVLQGTGRAAEAKVLIHRALASAPAGSELPDHACSLSNSAVYLVKAGRADLAEAVARRVLELDEQKYGASHKKVASDLEILAQILNNNGQPDAAEPLARRAVETFEAWGGPNDPALGRALQNLATIIQKLGRLSEAEAQYRKAETILVANFGEYHPKVATVRSNLSQLLRDTPLAAEAEDLMRNALSAADHSANPDPHRIATYLRELALVLIARGQIEDAEPLLRRAVAVAKACNDFDPEMMRGILNDLALLLQDTNRADAAEELLRQAIPSDEPVSSDSASTAHLLNSLALGLDARGRPDQAEALLRKSAEIMARVYGREHPKTAVVLGNLAGALQHSKHMDEAESLRRQVVAMLEGRNSMELAVALNNLGQLYAETHQFAQAEPLLRSAVTMAEEVGGKSPQDLALLLNNLGILLLESNRAVEAEQPLRRQLIILRDVMREGGRVPRLAKAANVYGSALLACGWTRERAIAEVRNIVPEAFV